MNQGCNICKSEYVYKIQEVREKYPRMGFRAMARLILKEIPEAFPNVLEVALAARLTRHFNHKHQPPVKSFDFKTPEPRNIEKEIQPYVKELNEGKISWQAFKDKLGVFAYTQMVKNPDKVKLRDFLQAETIQVSKEKLDFEKTSSAMEAFIMACFSGMPIDCPYCHKPILPSMMSKTIEKQNSIEGEVVKQHEQFITKIVP